MANGFDVRLQIIGLGDCMKAMRKASPTAAKLIQKQLREAAMIVVKSARNGVPARSPLTGWRTVEPANRGTWANRALGRNGRGWPAWQPSEIKRQIKVRMRRTKAKSVSRGQAFRTAVAVRSTSPAGTVYEFAKKSHRSSQFPYVNSLPFVKGLGDSHGGRLVWEAFDRNRQEVGDKVNAAVKDLEKQTQSLIHGAKDVM